MTEREDAIPHRPQRGIVLMEAIDYQPSAVTFAEGLALVTYHKPRYALWQGRPAMDLDLPVVATWTAGDGTWDRPPLPPGGRPTQARGDEEVRDAA